jgi:hypothetical protein
MPKSRVGKTHDQILWMLFLFAMSAYALTQAGTAAIAMGEAAHDAFCVEHGWAAR